MTSFSRWLIIRAWLLTATATALFAAEPSFVRVPDGPLLWTQQVLPRQVSGDAAAQAVDLLEQLEGVVTRAGAELSGVVRLNVYVTDDDALAAVTAQLGRKFATARPAMTIVRSAVPKTGARMACDAVAKVAASGPQVKLVPDSGAVMPAGGKIFISGQAERGSDVASAVKLTMAGLHRSLAHLGLKKSDVVQVKAFIQPFADHEAAARAVRASFEGELAPPVILMEWVSDLFAEIELVASAPARPSSPDEKVTFAWLPWLTKSTRYCNVTHVAAGTPLIFIGAVDGGEAADPRAQIRTAFERLGSTLFEAGSSYRDLVKATYYFANPAARALLNDIRDTYYDPTRPPAASALNLDGLGYGRRGVMLDIIAVPVK